MILHIRKYCFQIYIIMYVDAKKDAGMVVACGDYLNTLGCCTKDTMEKKHGAFSFKKEDLEIDLRDGTRYIVNPEKDVCLYKIPYGPKRKGEEFYTHKTKNHGRKYYGEEFPFDILNIVNSSGTVIQGTIEVSKGSEDLY
jgi:hypothetical protein